jgi:hypothetical protein
MKKLLFIIILAFVICNLTFVICAAQEPYLHIYWILGATNPGTYPSPNGQNMYYDSVVAKDIIGPTGNSGVDLNFAINAGTLATLEAGKSYDVFTTYAVPPNFYHIGPTPVAISGKGYEDVGTLVVAEGMGEIPGVADLKIERVGTTSNYKLSWGAAGSPINVFRIATNDAASIYDDIAFIGGTQLVSAAPISEYQIPDADDRIGAGFHQAYYKVTLSEFDLIEPMRVQAIITGDAVGKFNLNLYPTYNLVSAPLEPQSGDSIDAVFSNQLRDSGTEIYAFSEPSQGYTKALYTTGWGYTGELGAFPIDQGKAYWVYNPGARKTISYLGRVKRDPFSKNILPAYNLIGSPMARTYGNFGLAGLPASPARENDEAYLFNNATQVYGKMKIVGGVWQEATGGSEFPLWPTFGYWYYNGRLSPFGWTINP